MGDGMRHFAIVGSGPAGFYTAEALEKAYGAHARIDILDRFPVPYGLIRFGVAPDHQSLKAVSKRYDKVADCAGVDFVGNVTVGRDVSIAELLDLYDAVILATGAPTTASSASRARISRASSDQPSLLVGTTAIPTLPTSSRSCTALTPRSSATATSRLIARAFSRKLATSSRALTLSAMPSMRSTSLR
jgi:hypothetical protein